MRQNTLNLVGDGDDLDVLYASERAFDVRFSDEEAERTRTVGQFYDLILGKYRVAHPRTEACLTQAAFYRLRRALTEMRAHTRIEPATPLAHMSPGSRRVADIRRFWKELGHRSGLALPPLEVPFSLPEINLPLVLDESRLGRLACGAVVAGLWLASAIGLSKLTGISVGWVIVAIGFSTIALIHVGHLLLRLACATIPRRLNSLGELAREAAGHSFTELHNQNGGASPSDLWYAMTASLRDISGCNAAIDRETTFFRQAQAPEKRKA